MKISELVELLEAIKAEHGDVDVVYIDNGDFPETPSGQTEPLPQYSDGVVVL